jgi:hypothetical protein
MSMYHVDPEERARTIVLGSPERIRVSVFNDRAPAKAWLLEG